MTTIEFTPSNERPVFVASDGRRARWLRCAGAAAVILGCLWLAGLGVGMLGFGQLPGLSLPSIGRAADGPSLDRVTPTPRSSQVSPAVAGTMPIGQRAAAARPARKASKALRASHTTATAKVTRPTRARTVSKPAAPIQAVQPPVAAAPAAPASPPLRQGWARRGWSTPPGETRRSQPAPTVTEAQPSSTAPGQTRPRGGTETTPTTPETAPLPPGQQKKADEPNP
jgi:hypothetical protein